MRTQTLFGLVLQELWTLFDWVHQGALLGTLRTFKMEFENPIIRVCIHVCVCMYPCECRHMSVLVLLHLYISVLHFLVFLFLYMYVLSRIYLFCFFLCYTDGIIHEKFLLQRFF